MEAEKMWWKSHPLYPHEVIQTSSLGRPQKKSVGHNDCFYVTPVLQWRVRKPRKDISLAHKITFK